MVNIAPSEIYQFDVVTIRGSWQYMGDLVESDDMDQIRPFQRKFAPVPKVWDDDDQRFASYRLIVHLLHDPDPSIPLAISMSAIPSAYRLYVNGELKAQKGIVGRTSQEETPSLGDLHFSLIPGTQILDIVLQVSSFHHHIGGVTSPLIISKEKSFQQNKNREFALSMLLAGCAMILGLYHMGLFFVGYNNPSIVRLFLIAMAITLRPFIDEDYSILPLFFETIPWRPYHILKVLVFGSIVPLAVDLIRCMRPKTFPLAFQYIILFAFGTAVLATLSAPHPVHTRVFEWLLIFYLLVVITIGIHSAWFDLRFVRGNPMQYLTLAGLVAATFIDYTSFSRQFIDMGRMDLVWSSTILTAVLAIDSLQLASRLSHMSSFATAQEKEIMRLNQQHKEHIKLLDRQIDDAGHRLIQQEKLAAIGHLAAGIAFELNNPMAIIQGYSQNLSKAADQGRLTPNLLDRSRIGITSALDRMKRVIDSLKNVSESTGNPQLQPCSLLEIIHSVLILTKARFNKDGINLKLSNELPDSDDLVVASSAQVCQIVINLLNNAFEALHRVPAQTHREVMIIVWRDQLGATCLAVNDNGPGVEPDLRHRIFDAFYTTKDVGEGTGLGLSTSQSLAQQNGATLELVNLRHPTSFVLTLTQASSS